jgi:hypothetical protein
MIPWLISQLAQKFGNIGFQIIENQCCQIFVG